MKLHSLADLKAVKKTIEAQAQQAAAEKIRQALLKKQQAAQHTLFQAAIGKVQPLTPSVRADLKSAAPAAIPQAAPSTLKKMAK